MKYLSISTGRIGDRRFLAILETLITIEYLTFLTKFTTIVKKVDL